MSDKWNTVPAEPTDEMRAVIRNEQTVYASEDELYVALVGAAPQPPVSSDYARGQMAMREAMQKIESAMSCHPNAVKFLVGEAWDALNEAIATLPIAAQPTAKESSVVAQPVAQEAVAWRCDATHEDDIDGEEDVVICLNEREAETYRDESGYIITPLYLAPPESADVAALRAELDRERVRLAACGVIAMSDTPESAALARIMHPDYKSASCDDVARRVDECIALRAEVERRAKQRDELLAALKLTLRYIKDRRHSRTQAVVRAIRAIVEVEANHG